MSELVKYQVQHLQFVYWIELGIEDI